VVTSRAMRTWCLALVVVASCGKSDTPPPGPGSGSATVAPPPPAGLEIFVDSARVATIAPSLLAQWPRLDTLVPIAARRLGKWDNVELVGAGAKPAEIHTPSAQYPELVPAIFPGADGTPSFGMFDPVELAKHGNPSVREEHLREVRITLAKDSGRGEHEQGKGGGDDPTKLQITFKTPKGTHVIEGAKLLELPREKVPGTGDGKGWPLATILELGGVKKFDKLALTDVNGTALNVDKSAFDPKTSMPFVKLNRQGKLRLRIYKKEGENWNPTGGDLRAFAGVEVLK
jgi:hypothetical protein